MRCGDNEYSDDFVEVIDDNRLPNIDISLAFAPATNPRNVGTSDAVYSRTVLRLRGDVTQMALCSGKYSGSKDSVVVFIRPSDSVFSFPLLLLLLVGSSEDRRVLGEVSISHNT